MQQIYIHMCSSNAKQSVVLVLFLSPQYSGTSEF